MRIIANYYQQFDADLRLPVPAEGYGGWKQAEIEIAPAHTALVILHAWDCGTREQFLGWFHCVDFIPRADKICRTVFPRLLAAARSSGMKLFHVVCEQGNFTRHLGYQMTLRIAGPPEAKPELVNDDPVMRRLREFRADHVSVGKHNREDVTRGIARLDFPAEAKPMDDEPIAQTSGQLFALCKDAGVNHLIYAGFAVNGCMLLSPGGMADMNRHGVMCSVIRQAVTAIENKETSRSEAAKELALWYVALVFGFVFDVDDLITAIERAKAAGA
jgi:hypothetical protein